MTDEADEFDWPEQRVHWSNAAQYQRLRFIDFLAEHFGVLQRRFLMDYFGMSQVQASLDLRLYRDLAPDNLDYDPAGRCYRRTAAFKRRFP